MQFSTVFIVILVVLLALLAVLYFLGRRMEKQRAEQQEQIAAHAQQITVLVIDKKRMKLKDAGMPDYLMKETPWYTKNAKVPVVKVKAGPQILNLICAEEIFDEIPLKKEVKATVSGLYLTNVKGIRGRLNKEPVKKGLRAKAADFIKRNQEKAGS